jgi:hypothetical protein
MFDRNFFSNVLSLHSGEFAETYRVPHPKIEVVLRDATSFWVNRIMLVEDGYVVLRQEKGPSQAQDWAVGYEEITRVVFDTSSGEGMGFQIPKTRDQER